MPVHYRGKHSWDWGCCLERERGCWAINVFVEEEKRAENELAAAGNMMIKAAQLWAMRAELEQEKGNGTYFFALVLHLQSHGIDSKHELLKKKIFFFQGKFQRMMKEMECVLFSIFPVSLYIWGLASQCHTWSYRGMNNTIGVIIVNIMAIHTNRHVYPVTEWPTSILMP